MIKKLKETCPQCGQNLIKETIKEEGVILIYCPRRNRHFSEIKKID